MFSETGIDRVDLRVMRRGAIVEVPPEAAPDGVLDLERRMSYFVSVEPAYRLEQLVLPPEVWEALHLAMDRIRLRALVYDEWGLREIEPHPHSALSLHGSPGTGKTTVAHALAAELGKRVLPVRASQLESKYHGEGGKYLNALFEAARCADAVLFVDEAETLLSRRFESVGQGSEQAVNTMRGELVQHLDRFEGLAIFATNLIGSYDPAFLSRLHHVHIPDPDHTARRELWRTHLPAALPHTLTDADLDLLADTDGIVGRDVKHVVEDAAITAARRGGAEGSVQAADVRIALAQFLARRPEFTGTEKSTPDGLHSLAPKIAARLITGANGMEGATE
ncbi:ATP-binding protein [Nonomuraea sp. MG754425]|uniref:ATP-binding protein n=1 Tax=Nonomuraea sp. MG754425 TaxID=2570319 RepID=UPI001F2DA6BF|nr:ATP-binding protein [Nonomuraea sp. MG754425]MCF6475386.1 ATP-binding protein [Nonomuraea sp. MG754425]